MAGTQDSGATTSEASYSSNNSNEACDFECNICFEIAQDPVITLCGHLYCWPCLYKWLRLHSHSHECPVCKALIEEEKVIPLYGRGKTPTDPRSKPVPGVEIPSRPAGERPETAPAPDRNVYDLMFGLMGGFMPLAFASFGNFGMSATFGGVFSPFFVQFNGNGFPGFGATPPVYPHAYDGGRSRRNNGRLGGEAGNRGGNQEDDEKLKKILFIIIFFVVIALLVL